MNSSTITTTTTAATQARLAEQRQLGEAERLLTTAGIGFTEVDRCPVPGCSLCARPNALPAAA